MSRPSFRIYLSPPSQAGTEARYLAEALASGWLAPAGPQLEAFEHSLAQLTQRQHTIATQSGTAALHLALRVAGIGRGDRVLCPTFTYVATINPIRYVGAEPVFVDCDPNDWHLSPYWLQKAVAGECAAGRKPKALIVADLYGGMADYHPIEQLCAEYDIMLIEDAAESLGASYCGQPAGSFGQFAALSFNGNKLITTSGGGALLTNLQPAAEHALALAAQAREPHMFWHHHTEEGYTYRLSNLLAAVGLAQLEELERWTGLRQAIRRRYAEALAPDDRFRIVTHPPEVRPSDWLTVVRLSANGRLEPSELQTRLASQGIETRRTWAPLQAMPLFEHCRYYGGQSAAAWFDSTLCLPSGTFLTHEQQHEIVAALRAS